MPDMTAKTVAQTTFGITTDRVQQFGSAVWSSVMT